MKYLFLLMLILKSVSQFAQVNDSKRGNIWFWGSQCGIDPQTGQQYENFGVKYLDFNTQSPSLYLSCPNILGMDLARAGICDTSGNLIFLTNGYVLMDGNGNTLDSPRVDDEYISRIGRTPPQSVLILPLPENPSKYIFINQPMLRNCPTCELSHEELYETIIDYNGLNYTITSRNRLIFNRAMAAGKMSACRHANGRDWWIIVPAYHSNNYFKFILDPDGVRYIGQQSVGQDYLNLGVGQTCFSPDGTKFGNIEARISVWQGYPGGTQLDLFDFDRCTGNLTSTGQWLESRLSITSGTAFSQNSRFAYASNDTFVYQIDTWRSPMRLDTVKVYSGLVDTLVFVPPVFTQPLFYSVMQLAPNGKIYIGTSGARYIHTIEQPDVAGIGSQVTDKGLSLGTYNGFGVPNYPHFRLGRMEGSPCDTVYIGVGEVDDGGVKVYPNPATHVLTIETTKSIGVIEIFDVLGRPVSIIQLQSNISTLDISEYAKGVYLVKVTDGGGRFVVKKIVVE